MKTRTTLLFGALLAGISTAHAETTGGTKPSETPAQDTSAPAPSPSKPADVPPKPDIETSPCSAAEPRLPGYA